MQKQFDNILDFTKLREKCIFCQAPLRIRLANYVNPRENELPILNSPIRDGHFSFHVERTTESYSVRSDGMIDIVTGDLVMSLVADSDTPFYDRHIAEQAFRELKPYIQLGCENFNCDSIYNISSDILRMKYSDPYLFKWKVLSPTKLWLETFRTSSLLVQSDWIMGNTFIYSRHNENADPIKATFMDFGSFDKEHLLRRISTLVTFS